MSFSALSIVVGWVVLPLLLTNRALCRWGNSIPFAQNRCSIYKLKFIVFFCCPMLFVTLEPQPMLANSRCNNVVPPLAQNHLLYAAFVSYTCIGLSKTVSQNSCILPTQGHCQLYQVKSQPETMSACRKPDNLS